MNARTVLVGVVAVTLVAAAATGCAMLKKKSPEEVVGERQQLMKRQGELWKDIQDKTKVGDTQAVAVDANQLAGSAKQIPKLFPEGSMTPKSNAKPEIWQKKAEFNTTAMKLRTESLRLRDTAKSGDAAATQAIVKDFGRTTCGACHTPFRVPPKQS